MELYCIKTTPSYKNKFFSLFTLSFFLLKRNLNKTYAASKGEEIEVLVRYIERLEEGCRIGGRKKDRGECEGERERVEVKTDGWTDGRRIPDKWIKRKLLNSV